VLLGLSGRSVEPFVSQESGDWPLRGFVQERQGVGSPLWS
jgi:hypothetical protein